MRNDVGRGGSGAEARARNRCDLIEGERGWSEEEAGSRGRGGPAGRGRRMAHDTYLRFVLVPTMDNEPHPNRFGDSDMGIAFLVFFFSHAQDRPLLS